MFEKEWEAIAREWEDLQTMSCKPTIKKLPKGYITDEEQSVKWNRDQVEQNHLAYENAVKQLNAEKNRRRDEICQCIYDLIQKEVGPKLHRTGARKIWEMAYNQSRSYGFTAVYWRIADLISLAKVILNKEKKNND